MGHPVDETLSSDRKRFRPHPDSSTTVGHHIDQPDVPIAHHFG
jgi:hypothetical protein